uniref:Uncharacterized protein n=1 Tax=Arundo donax TaxID=35708 RepID=A0A0A9HDZ3_ARUDO
MMLLYNVIADAYYLLAILPLIQFNLGAPTPLVSCSCYFR